MTDKYYDGNSSNPTFFLYVGGEGSIVMKYMCWDNYTFMGWTKKHKGIAIQLEHRFFGVSFPKKTKDGLVDMSLETLSLLTIKQALADLANFIQTFQYNGKPMKDATWVVVGASYPGALCAWFRALYPDLTVGGVCSSAPVWPKVDFYGNIPLVQICIIISIKYFKSSLK